MTKTETHAEYFHNGTSHRSERMSVADAYALIAELGDQVADSYTVYGNEDSCPIGECYEVYGEGETTEDYPDGDAYAATITIFFASR